MKPWYRSRIHWTNILSTILSILPFLLDYLNAAAIPAEDKALWIFVVQVATAGLTSVFRNSTTKAIGPVPDDDDTEHA